MSVLVSGVALFLDTPYGGIKSTSRLTQYVKYLS